MEVSNYNSIKSEVLLNDPASLRSWFRWLWQTHFNMMIAKLQVQNLFLSVIPLDAHESVVHLLRENGSVSINCYVKDIGRRSEAHLDMYDHTCTLSNDTNNTQYRLQIGDTDHYEMLTIEKSEHDSIEGAELVTERKSLGLRFIHRLQKLKLKKMQPIRIHDHLFGNKKSKIVCSSCKKHIQPSCIPLNYIRGQVVLCTK